MKKFMLLITGLLGMGCLIQAQNAPGNYIRFQTEGGLNLNCLVTAPGEELPLGNRPLFTLLLNGKLFSSAELTGLSVNDSLIGKFSNGLGVEVKQVSGFQPGLKYLLRFRNTGSDKIVLENVVPFGESGEYPYITATESKEWPGYLCRSQIFLPGGKGVGVVLPDNAWHLGWSDLPLRNDTSVVALCRRGKHGDADIDRWAATLKPGGWIEYSFYFDLHTGDWHRGLELMFRDRFLYDLPGFDYSLFRRNDLKWIRHSYLMLLQFAWDKTWYDPLSQKYSFDQNLFRYDKLTGGWDIFTIWPTWPRLGLDERNQFDMYRDLPGGLAELKRQSQLAHRYGKKYFISYNPWDEGTRHEEPMSGLETLIRDSDADGVVLDTRGESSRELQAAADKVKPGVIMYSEGMAVPHDMPGIVSGRVHNALFMPPPLNLNKFIKPDFAIFRVIDLAESDVHREIAVSFFNGYGIEINTMRPGRPGWVEREFGFMGNTSRILRENTTAFNDTSWTPLIPAVPANTWVNEWKDGLKKIYTVYSLNPEGYKGPLIQQDTDTAFHCVDLWNHEDCIISAKDGKSYAGAEVAAFNRNWLGSRKEGSIACIALLPEILHCRIAGDSLLVSARSGDEIRVWAGNPSYSKVPLILHSGHASVSLSRYFKGYDDKFIVQLFKSGELQDEIVLPYTPGTPRLVSVPVRTVPARKSPEGMVEIPAANYSCLIRRDSSSPEPFIAFPDYSRARIIPMCRFFMDLTPVTNRQFYEFISSTHYSPADTSNFLRHWVNQRPPEGKEEHPVVYISLEDARAYARWAGKRLPTETEWQYAAQGCDGRKFPWGNTMDSTRCNFKLNHTTATGLFLNGKSVFGAMDLTGNVWQMTDDVYDNGSYLYNIIRGGSFYSPESSIWYVAGGPVPVFHPEMILLVSPGLDRCSTVGFRCVKDAE